MTHTLHILVLRDLETGRQLGLGGIAPTARCVSLKVRGLDRLQRRYATASEWPEFEARAAEHFPPTPFESKVVVRTLLSSDERAHQSAVLDSLPGQRCTAARTRDATRHGARTAWSRAKTGGNP